MTLLPGKTHLTRELAQAGKSGNRKRDPRPTRQTQEPGFERGKGSSDASGNKAFQVRCEPHDQRHALVSSLGLSIFVTQRIRMNDSERMWDSVIIHGTEEADGTLAVRVFISNPDWQEQLQIACIRSRPDDRESLTALGCNLDHVSETKI